MNNEDQLTDSSVDDGLTDEERALDAQMIAADLGPIFAPMIQAKRARVAKSGHRKKRDRRFSVSALDGPDGFASPTAADGEPWDWEPTEAFDEIRRISQLAHTYRDGASKGELILKILDGRAQTIDNLKKLYALSQRRYKNGLKPFDSTIVDLIVSILVKEGAMEQPASEWAAGDPKGWIQFDSEGKLR